jgi:endonuclease/exonuclease/phosphatase family metal-dependent hydrolase
MGFILPARGRLAALALAVAGTLLVAAPAHAEQTDITVITHNIRGGQINNGNLAALDAVTNQVNTHLPDVVMLQEVCASQYAEFVRRFPASAGWTVHFSPRKHHTGCGEQIGEVIATPRNGASGLYAPELASENPTGIKYHLSCLTFLKNGGREYLACTTHLSAGADNASIREAQLNQIKAELQWSVDYGRGVVFGGDLNMLPSNPSMNKLYKIRNDGTQTGAGSFYEGDQDDTRWYGSACATSRPFCKTGESTKLGEKFDYVFFDAVRTKPSGSTISETVAGKGLSNHNVVRATSRFYW